MAITLRETAIDTSGKATELSYQEMNNNLKSFYYSSSLNGDTLDLHFLSGSTSHSISVPSIYTADSTLTSTRTVEAGGNDLSFDMSTANFILTSDPGQRVTIANLPTANTPQVLGIDSSGNVKAMSTSSIAGGGGTPGGSDTQVQYNNGGSFGGSAIYFDDVNNSVGINVAPYSNRALAISSSLGIPVRLQSTVATANRIQFVNASSVGNGVLMGAVDGDSFHLQQTDGDLLTNLYISSSGEAYLPRIASSSKANVVGLDTATGELTYFSTASFGGGSASPGGSDGQVQYNNGGSFGGESTFTYDDGNNTLTIEGATNQPSIVLSNAQSVSITNGSQLSEIQTFYSTNEVGTIAFVAEGGFNPGDLPTRLELRTTNDGAASPTTKMTIKNNGRVGIGVTSPTNGFLEVSGNVSGTSIYASANIVAYSDARSKTNVETISGALDKVDAIRGVTYNKVEDPEGIRYMGVIAQELQEVLPEVVAEGEDGRLAVAYGNIVGVLIEAVKELRAEVAELKANK
jgi:hypothetical protein